LSRWHLVELEGESSPAELGLKADGRAAEGAEELLQQRESQAERGSPDLSENCAAGSSVLIAGSVSPLTKTVSSPPRSTSQASAQQEAGRMSARAADDGAATA
jgi:hypothetical protein